MEENQRIHNVIEELKNGLQEDPRREKVLGEEGPRDYLFTKQVVSWLKKLESSPSDALLIAAWGHVLFRWRIPREQYPMNTKGYHQWRQAQSALSSAEVDKILLENECDEKTRERVRSLILKTHFPSDPEAQSLEDADCLAFLETKLDQYLPQWDDAKTVRILKGTLEKMSERAKEVALQMSQSPAVRRLLDLAVRS